MARFHDHEFADPRLAEVASFISSAQGNTETFETLVRALSCWHHEKIPFYRSLCEIRQQRPADSKCSSDHPAAATEAFKRLELHAEPARVVHRFATSGTSGGEDRKGIAAFSKDDLALMDGAILTNAAKYLFPDHPERTTRILVLAPPPEQAPQMIMAYGMDRIREAYGSPESCFLVGANGLDTGEFVRHLEEASSAGEAVTLIGASFGFVHLLDGFDEKGLRFHLPEHSRIMDAGGFKGRAREVAREELVARFGDVLGVAPTHCVNLLGMTELASQFYDDTLAAFYANRPPRSGKQNPFWTHTFAADPETLQRLPHGDVGILRHTDLANGGRPLHIQTDDLGYTTDEGFVILGRAKGSASRGCSLSVDELLAAVEAEA